jgi:hypothetical protein
VGIFAGFVLLAGGLALLWLSWQGSRRRLPPNGSVGIRTAWSRASDESWYVTHEAAAGPLGVGGATAALAGLGVVVLGGSTTLATVIGGLGVGGLLGGVVVGTVVARRAVDRSTAS